MGVTHPRSYPDVHPLSPSSYFSRAKHPGRDEPSLLRIGSPGVQRSDVMRSAALRQVAINTDDGLAETKETKHVLRYVLQMSMHHALLASH